MTIPLAQRYSRIRARTLALCSTLAVEDMVVQSLPEGSPLKWHLAHTSWFFEQFALARESGYRAVHPEWGMLFNSYYQLIGTVPARAQRGLMSRPTLREILDYRAQIDERVLALLARDDDPDLAAIVELGLQHEQQHQELLLTDIQHVYWVNPLAPAYLSDAPAPQAAEPIPLAFLQGLEGIHEIGHAGSGFAFDNECPRHPVLLHRHQIANRPINNGEYREFILDGGYRKPSLWMSEGWVIVQQQAWSRPLYWNEDLSRAFTLAGTRELETLAPVCHVSFFEADAYARWAGARLPTEAEWEVLAASQSTRDGNFQESGHLRPLPPAARAGALQLFGDVWEWTSSPYVNYPGFRPLPGALGEYNGKFMCGQWVLRGGSCATPEDHIRPSYRNFFYPADRWQFSGFRLGRDG